MTCGSAGNEYFTSTVIWTVAEKKLLRITNNMIVIKQRRNAAGQKEQLPLVCHNLVNSFPIPILTHMRARAPTHTPIHAHTNTHTYASAQTLFLRSVSLVGPLDLLLSCTVAGWLQGRPTWCTRQLSINQLEPRKLMACHVVDSGIFLAASKDGSATRRLVLMFGTSRACPAQTFSVVVDVTAE